MSGHRRSNAKIILILICGLVFVEVTSLLVLYVNDTKYREYYSSEEFLDQYWVSSAYSSLLLSDHDPIFPHKKFIGYLYNTHQQRWGQFFSPHPILGWKNEKNVEAIQVSPYKHRTKYRYITNPQGFILSGAEDSVYDKNKPTNVYRIIVVGGSTVFGAGAKMPQGNLPAMIRSHISRSFDYDIIEVINAGVGGYVSIQEFLYTSMELVHYNPDLIIVYDGANDSVLYNGGIAKYRERWSPQQLDYIKKNTYLLKAAHSVSGSFFQTLGLIKSHVTMRKLAMYEIARRVVRKIAVASDISQNDQDTRFANIYDRQSVLTYASYLKMMISVAKSQNIKIAIFLQPLLGVGKKTMTSEEAHFLNTGLTGGGISLIDRQSFYKDARSIFAQMANKYKDDPQVLVGDLSQSLNNEVEMIYLDSSHLNERGNEIVAGAIVEALVVKGFIGD